jgi:hypothetical protein
MLLQNIRTAFKTVRCHNPEDHNQRIITVLLNRNKHTVTQWSDYRWCLDCIYCTLYRPPLQRDQCSQSRCLVPTSNGRRSYASRLTSSQAGNHLTPTSYSGFWLQVALLSAASFQVELTNCHLKTPS